MFPIWAWRRCDCPFNNVGAFRRHQLPTGPVVGKRDLVVLRHCRRCYWLWFERGDVPAEVDPGVAAIDCGLEVLGEPAVTVQPGEGSELPSPTPDPKGLGDDLGSLRED